jgi:hypothetical protein
MSPPPPEIGAVDPGVARGRDGDVRTADVRDTIAVEVTGDVVGDAVEIEVLVHTQRAVPRSDDARRLHRVDHRLPDVVLRMEDVRRPEQASRVGNTVGVEILMTSGRQRLRPGGETLRLQQGRRERS